MRYQKIFSEFLGTAILVTIICGAIVIPDYVPPSGIATLTITSASGFAVAVLTYTIGPRQGSIIVS